MPRFLPLLIWVCLSQPVHAFGAESARASATIYRCEVDGVATFSDRPCGDQSSAYEPDAALVSTYTAPPTSVAPDAARRSPAETDRQRRVHRGGSGEASGGMPAHPGVPARHSFADARRLQRERG